MIALTDKVILNAYKKRDILLVGFDYSSFYGL